VQVINPPAGFAGEPFELRRKGMTAGFRLQFNAIRTALVNLDATGNRVAAMCFGPKKVILVVGEQVARTWTSAMARVKHCAPVNTIRLLKNPAKRRVYVDCKSPQRLCNEYY
jgi:hypothetical protein